MCLDTSIHVLMTFNHIVYVCRFAWESCLSISVLRGYLDALIKINNNSPVGNRSEQTSAIIKYLVLDILCMVHKCR